MDTVEVAIASPRVRVAGDSLTGLLGRDSLRAVIASALERAEIGCSGVALACLDLDDFTRVNEALGYAAGDDLLRAVATRLTAVVRGGDRVVHFGGDKFIVVCSGVQLESDALRIAQRLAATLVEPFVIGETPIALSATIGIAVGDGLSSAPEDLLRDADTALHRAPRGGVGVFDESQRRSAVARLQIENALRASIERDELTLAYQPIVGLRNGSVVGFEALLRWEHPALGSISPLEFIPVAEQRGLIRPLGRWVLRRACEDLAALSERHGPHLHMSVNVSPAQIFDPALPADVTDILDETGIEPGRLHVELTEGVLAERGELACDALLKLRQTGVRLVIDDFGTGYSALSYLTRLPVDGVKIDRSFVKELDDQTPEAAIVAAVVSLARDLGLHVTAEGVETEGQAERLRELGCPLAQGFYFGRPAPAEYLDLLL
jgi:diguanylate cyclase (GGDEF)-like protein